MRSHLNSYAFGVALCLSCSLAFAGQVQIPDNGYINTIAGNGVQGTTGDGGSALNAELNVVMDLAFDGSGNLYLLDQCTVRKISAATGNISLLAGTGVCGYSGDNGPATAAELSTYVHTKLATETPGSLAIDPQDNIYIADTFNHRIRKLNTTTGIITTIAGNGTAGYSGDGGLATFSTLNLPSGVAVDQEGDLFISDSGNNRIRKIQASTGTISTVAGNGISGYAGDGGTAVGAELSNPGRIAVDTSGTVYVNDFGNKRIRSVSAATGRISTIAGTGAWGFSGDGDLATGAALNLPQGIAVDSFGNIYISDTGNYRVRYINSSTGRISTIAGNGTFSYSGDGGTATQAQLYCYGGIAVNAQSAVAISDSSVFRVRAIGGAGVTGVINPKYVIVGVTYAPPGPNSYVQYTNSTYVGNTTSLSSSFSQGYSISTSVAGKIKAWGVSTGFTGTSSSTATESSNGSSTVTLSMQSTLADKTTGTPDAFNPVNHDYDIVWLWLNPLVTLTLNPANPNILTWNGYAYDTADNNIVDVYPVYVGQLNGDFAMDPSTQAELSRSWATGQVWPNGEGPALTTVDYATILAADPFSNSSYAVSIAPSSSPSTTEDGRFTLSGGSGGNAQSFDYVQAPNNGGSLTQQYTNTYTDSQTTSVGGSLSFQQVFGLEEKFDGTFFGIGLSYDLKQSATLTWSHSSTQSMTNTATETDMLSISGPSCTGSPCSPAYSGPPEFQVFQDNLFGTFMFNPIN